MDIKKSLVRRFISYTEFDTMSNPENAGKKIPTTEGQKDLILQLEKELKALGLETMLDDTWVLSGVLKGNIKGRRIAFMAHVDTADDVMGNGVKANVIECYDGKDITLSSGAVISVEENPDLKKYEGGCIITSDGSTLLGSDDKAGVAIIMSVLEYIKENPDFPHPDIEVYFTCDEETGAGMDNFPYERVSAKVCYTIDGAEEPYIEDECFNAASITINAKGNSIHLGSARGKLVNAVTILSHIASALPQAESPEATDERYGYYCPLSLSGTQTEARLDVFIRDFDKAEFEHRIASVENLAKAIADIYRGSLEIISHVSYHNMGEINRRDSSAIDAIVNGGKNIGVDIRKTIIRGGTDGARMAERLGISCPNIFTGGHNLHSLKEWVSLDAMHRSALLVLEIMKIQVEA